MQELFLNRDSNRNEISKIDSNYSLSQEFPSFDILARLLLTMQYLPNKYKHIMSTVNSDHLVFASPSLLLIIFYAETRDLICSIPNAFNSPGTFVHFKGRKQNLF